MFLRKIKQFYHHIRSRSIPKQLGYLVFFGVVGFYSYVSYQVMYKPWLPTEFIEMERSINDDDDPSDYFIYHYYAVKNPPYSDRKRLQLIREHMKTDFVLAPDNKGLRISSDYSHEGWQPGFPFWSYVDRTFEPYPETGCMFGCDGRIITFAHRAPTLIARAEQLMANTEGWKCELRRMVTLYPHPFYPRSFRGENYITDEVYPSPECLKQAETSGSDGV